MEGLPAMFAFERGLMREYRKRMKATRMSSSARSAGCERVMYGGRHGWRPVGSSLAELQKIFHSAQMKSSLVNVLLGAPAAARLCAAAKMCARGPFLGS